MLLRHQNSHFDEMFQPLFLINEGRNITDQRLLRRNPQVTAALAPELAPCFNHHLCIIPGRGKLCHLTLADFPGKTFCGRMGDGQNLIAVLVYQLRAD
ncbi:hypothetical protein D3C75_862380 [compost metagenome]